MIEKVTESLVAAQPYVKYRLCVELIRPESLPLVGGPTLPFIDQGGSRGYRSEKKEKVEGIEGALREPGLPFSLSLPCLTWQTVLEVACSLIFVGHALALFSKWVRPILCRWMVRRTGELSYDPLGSNRGSDHTSVTIDDVIYVLDHNGCHMPMLVSTPKN